MTPGPGAALARRHAIAERYSQGDSASRLRRAGRLPAAKPVDTIYATLWPYDVFTQEKLCEYYVSALRLQPPSARRPPPGARGYRHLPPLLLPVPLCA